MKLFSYARFPRRVFLKIRKTFIKTLGGLRGFFLTKKLTARAKKARIIVKDPFFPIKIVVGQNAKFILRGQLNIGSYQGLREVVFISLERDSTLIIDGDFTIGPGCRVIVGKGGYLYIGGRGNESSSGITERSRIMVRKRVHIGVDLICSWGVFITDCDWHEISGNGNTAETIIGDHVWIAPNCSILKGSNIGNDCIIATGSVTHKASYESGALIGGAPARVLATDRHWRRDML